jgi:site-specific DNA-methyltransferase (adenine-specific)
MTNIKACLSTGKNDWETPDALFAEYDAEYDFVLDAMANKINRKCDLWFGPDGVEPDMLVVDWAPYLEIGNVWLNPEYGEPEHGCKHKIKDSEADFSRCKKKLCKLRGFHDIEYRPGCVDFVLKAATEVRRQSAHSVVCLLPSRTDTAMFHELMWQQPNTVVTFLKGRLRFKGSSAGAPFPSMIVVFS